MPKIVVTGGRDHLLSKDDEVWLLSVIESMRRHGVVKILVGDARGVDRCVRELCKKHGLLHEEFKADWDRFGKAAGPMRSMGMLRYAQRESNSLCVAFPGGKGTATCVRLARQLKLPVIFACSQEAGDRPSSLRAVV